MQSQKFYRSEFTGACVAVSSSFRGQRAEIEVLSPTDGVLIEARWLPLIGIAYDPTQDTLRIMLHGLDHFVYQPREMYLYFGAGGLRSLGILDQRSVWRIVSMRDPLMLPRPALASAATRDLGA